jgi:hypothetical protein
LHACINIDTILQHSVVGVYGFTVTATDGNDVVSGSGTLTVIDNLPPTWVTAPGS